MNKTTKYPFKRKIYNELTSSIKENKVTFLLGPRKCGKTICLKQVDENIPNTQYINFKELTTEEKSSVNNKISKAITNNENTIFLLDEITYALNPELFINKVANLYAEYNSNTKVVYTGSQSTALEYWSHIAYAGNAGYIRADFLTYKEWIEYKKNNKVSEESFTNYLLNINSFFGIVSFKEYLQSCLDEAIISNANTSNYIYGNECSRIDVDTLLDICYATLFSLHKQVNANTFMKKDALKNDILYYFSETCKELNIDKRISNSFISKYKEFARRDLKTLEEGFMFLNNCGLITITPVSNDLKNYFNVKDLFQAWKMSESSTINVKDDLFKKFNITINYPAFYVAILQDILGKDIELNSALLGSIVECQVRGLLSSKNALEYHDAYDREIDYVDTINEYALEISVRDKKIRNTHFDILPDNYKKILLTRTKESYDKEIIKIPYYKFIGENCDIEKMLAKSQ